MAADNGTAALPENDEDSDACLCGMDHREDEATSDEELPPASGGVKAAVDETPRNEDDVDACDLDFTTGEQTDDAELPASAGGM